jgi:SAM-dependent methyltransferase
LDPEVGGVQPPAFGVDPPVGAPRLGRWRGGALRGFPRDVFAKDWDRYVAQVDELARTASFRELRDTILDRAAPRAADSALDVGTGTGLLALPLAERTASVLALDVSVAMVECVRARAWDAGLRNVKPLVGSATRLPVEDGSIDVAVSNYCFHHLTSIEKQQSLGELHRVLVPGGRLVFGDMMFEAMITDRRGRAIIAAKAGALLRKGPGGFAPGQERGSDAGRRR